MASRSTKDVDSLFALVCTSNLFLTSIYFTIAARAEDPQIFLVVAVTYSALNLLCVGGWIYACLSESLRWRIVSWAVGIFLALSLFSGLLSTSLWAFRVLTDYKPSMQFATSISLVIATGITKRYVKSAYERAQNTEIDRIDKLCHRMFVGSIAVFLVFLVHAVLPWLVLLLIRTDP